MHTFIGICCVALLVAIVIWGIIPAKAGKGDASSPPPDDQLVDPSDSYQIGLLIGLSGGSIADAAVARFALQRFEEVHGRKATVREMGIVAGLMKP